MRLILVRHGETAWNREGRFQGQGPVGLNQLGIIQARKVARALVPMSPVTLYSSPLPRTLMTAQEISKELSIPVAALDGIKEVDLGELEGITDREMRSRYAQVYTAWRENPSELVFPGGESIQQLQERCWQAIEGVEKAHPKELVVAVSHNFAIRSILCSCMGLPLSKFHRLRVDLASISIVQASATSLQVLSINDKCHLSQDGL